jgi:hypothetical protein
VDLKETGWEDIDLIPLAQDRYPDGLLWTSQIHKKFMYMWANITEGWLLFGTCELQNWTCQMLGIVVTLHFHLHGTQLESAEKPATVTGFLSQWHLEAYVPPKPEAPSYKAIVAIIMKTRFVGLEVCAVESKHYEGTTFMYI